MASAELNDFVERVSQRTDIYAVVSRYVSLKQKGGRYWGRCPFHDEKTASFSVSADKGLFYCFGCGAGGNAFKFLSLIENISYFDAIKLQAERLGIELPKRKLSPEEDRRRREEKILLNINTVAQDFYHECLIKTARGENGRKYLAGRGITLETIETFNLGYAPDDWDSLLTKLTRQDFLPQQIESVGLIARRKNSSGYYDRFRGRVMIPITDLRGNVVGFGGRILKAEDESTPKYLNTPETALFNKRNLLFGLDKSNRAITAAGSVIVVEGYMDAISLFSAGVKNVVATLGTAFTTEHAKLIERYTRKIFFCYDSDEAGQRATIRALPMIQDVSAEVFVIKIPDGKDPDEFIRKHGKAAFDNLIKNAETIVNYRINFIVARSDISTTPGKIQALREILPVVINARTVAVRNEYIKRIAARLALDEQILRDEWQIFAKTAAQRGESYTKKNPNAVKREALPKVETPVVTELCDTIVRMAWHEGDILDYIFAVVPMELFPETHREILAWLKACVDMNTRADQMLAANELSEDANTQLSRILIEGTDEPRASELAVFEESIKILQRIALKKQYEKIFSQMENMSNDSDAYNKALQETTKLKQQIESLM